ncbi:LmbE family N-acetylglucosaminyl deacetylase [Thermocatellispora tengchongensis]|uniref:LmbE family N-acetylglucosaminyl deacetylase n=1 Tax=Thermocatellispora tengchongensis TaxID=1073253 RepID=A0A840PNE5_9ACTN|nr:PIG-L family deacetylase [Thermocatellispora tengchongensis]MBB5139220.1 LmbE family N-acetylglucosaminyl deacetylase [Thermocatellispora tengchongensis]
MDAEATDAPLTIMAVHAHPDDEVIGTGGILARYAAEGIRTVLVTCTNGEQGDGPGGVKPGDEGHDAEQVAERRLGELRESVAHLGITHLELLGYRDSGMDGWDTNQHEAAFWNVPLDQATARLAALMERYRPQVVVTYDENGGYGHPDHIQAHRIAKAATEATGIPDKLYYTAVPRSRVREMFRQMREMGIDVGGELPDDFGTPDELITTVVDVSPHVEAKIKALRAHESQGENIFLLRLPDDVQHAAFSHEVFIRHWSRIDAPTPEDDLFAGLRA